MHVYYDCLDHRRVTQHQACLQDMTKSESYLESPLHENSPLKLQQHDFTRPSAA